jgi:hypothetical protein
MIDELVISDWRDILELGIESPLEYFRGQSNAEWELSSSLQRCLIANNLTDDPVNTEFWLLRDFRRGAARYLDRLPAEDDLISWLSLMQHHGAPTRLIDFTKSFYVACYFTLIDARGGSAVWAIDPFFLFEVAEKALKAKMSGLRDEWDDNSTRSANAFLLKILASAAAASDTEVIPGAVAAEPREIHARLGAQQGLFIMPLDLQLNLTDNLAKYIAKDKKLIRKIILREEMRNAGLAHLREMNITSETLFPGIDGFARALVHHRLY